MAVAPSLDIADFARRDCTFRGRTRPVLTTGTHGPAVIVVHEIYGFTPTLARFCRWLRDGGFRVYAPILLGTPDAANPERDSLARKLGLCVSREFAIFSANRSSPVVDWLKELGRTAHGECGGPGVGVIGMCLTGNFALSMAVDPTVLAPVLAEPSLPPFPATALHIAPAELARVKARVADEGLLVRGYRFAGDKLCPPARFAALRAALGTGFAGAELPDAAGNPDGMRARGKPPHSVFTGDLIDAASEPTRRAVDEVIGFFQARLGAGPAQADAPV
jgi:dienelactone hydrolase